MCEMLVEIIEICSSFAASPTPPSPVFLILCSKSAHCANKAALGCKEPLPHPTPTPRLSPCCMASAWGEFKCLPSWLVTGNALFDQEFPSWQSLSSHGDEGWWMEAADAPGEAPGSRVCSCCAEGFPLPRVLWWHPGSPRLHSRGSEAQ